MRIRRTRWCPQTIENCRKSAMKLPDTPPLSLRLIKTSGAHYALFSRSLLFYGLVLQFSCLYIIGFDGLPAHGRPQHLSGSLLPLYHLSVTQRSSCCLASCSTSALAACSTSPDQPPTCPPPSCEAPIRRASKSVTCGKRLCLTARGSFLKVIEHLSHCSW